MRCCLDSVLTTLLDNQSYDCITQLCAAIISSCCSLDRLAKSSLWYAHMPFAGTAIFLCRLCSYSTSRGTRSDKKKEPKSAKLIIPAFPSLAARVTKLFVKFTEPFTSIWYVLRESRIARLPSFVSLLTEIPTCFSTAMTLSNGS